MAKLQLNNTDVIEQVSSTDVTYKFPGPNHTFSVKALNQPISGTTNSTNDDANSDQLAVYNGSTKLFGITEHGYVLAPQNAVFAGANSNDSGKWKGFSTINVSNSYWDNTNGIFTCPVSGVYFLSVHGQSASTVFYWGLKKNGTVTTATLSAYASYNTGSNYMHAPSSTAISCSAGDYLEFVTVNGSLNTGGQNGLTIFLLR